MVAACYRWLPEWLPPPIIYDCSHCAATLEFSFIFIFIPHQVILINQTSCTRHDDIAMICSLIYSCVTSSLEQRLMYQLLITWAVNNKSTNQIISQSFCNDWQSTAKGKGL